MKSKEIITKLDIQDGLKGKKKQDQFLSVMIDELIEIYNRFGQKDSERHFTASVKELRHKWDGISIKIGGGLSDGLWNFFFASKIVKLKEELCPTWAERQKHEHDRYVARQKKHEEKRAEYDKMINEKYSEE